MTDIVASARAVDAPPDEMDVLEGYIEGLHGYEPEPGRSAPYGRGWREGRMAAGGMLSEAGPWRPN